MNAKATWMPATWGPNAVFFWELGSPSNILTSFSYPCTSLPSSERSLLQLAEEVNKREKKTELLLFVAYFSSPASPWEACWLFFFSRVALNQEAVGARKDLEGLPDRASVHGNNHPGRMNCRYNGFTAMNEYWALKLFHCLRCANGRHFLGREWSSLTPWHCHARAALRVYTISLVAYRR